VRNSEKGAQVASQYPQIELVYGDNESTDVIAKEVQKADIVMREFSLSLIHSPHPQEYT